MFNDIPDLILKRMRQLEQMDARQGPGDEAGTPEQGE